MSRLPSGLVDRAHPFVLVLVLVLAAVLGPRAAPARADEGAAPDVAPSSSDAPPAGLVTVKVLPLTRTGPFARRGSWTWVHVSLESAGATPLEGVLRAYRGSGQRSGRRAPVVFERPLTLAPRALRHERLPVFCAEEDAPLVVAFYARGANEEPLASAVTELKDRGTWHALVVSRDDAALSLFRGAALGGLRRVEVEAAALEVEALPELRQSYGAVDGLALVGADLRALTPGQGAAIEGFVEAGGQLLVAFSGSALEWRDTALAPLLPVDLPGGVVPRSMAPFASLGGTDPAAVTGTAPAAIVEPRPGAHVLLRGDDGAPLVVRRRAGAGHVTFVAIDPTRRPFRGSAAARALIEASLGAPAEPLDDEALGRAEADRLATGLTDLARTSSAVVTPPWWLVGSALALYITLAVPVNYVFWRRRGRTERAAPTAVALAALASVAVFAIGDAYRGGVSAATELLLVDGAVLEPRGRATLTSGILPAERRIARAEGPLLAAPAPTLDARVLERERRLAAAVRADTSARAPRHEIDPLELDQSAWRTLTASGEAAVPLVRADVALGNGRLIGSIEAPRETALRGAFLVVGRRVARIGDVPAGEPKRFSAVLEPFDARRHDVDLGAASGGAVLSLGPAELVALAARRPHLGAHEGGLEALLFAAVDPEPTPLIAFDFAPPWVRRARLLALSLTISLADGEPITIPAGLLRPRVSLETGSAVDRDDGIFASLQPGAPAPIERAYRFDKGRLELTFTLPWGRALALDRVAIELRCPKEAPGIGAAALGPAGASEPLVLDSNFSATLKSPGPLVDPRTGTLRLAVEVPEEPWAPLTFREPEIVVKGRKVASSR